MNCKKEQIFEQIKKSICIIYKDEIEKGIGFLCKIQFKEHINFLIINNNLLSSIDFEREKFIKFRIDNEKEYRYIKKDNLKIIKNEEIGITFIEIKENLNIFLEVDDKVKEEKKDIKKKDLIYIIKNEEKNEINKIYGYNIKIEHKYIYLKNNKKKGLIGSPIILSDNLKTIGIIYENNKNIDKGILINYCIKEIISKKNKQIISIIYKIEEKDKKIKIFDEDFIKNNRENCKIIIDGEEREICSELKINEKMKKRKTIEIKLIEYKTITNMFCMFAECFSLISLPDISKFDTSKVENMSCLFFKCSSLKPLPDISNWNTQNINNILSMFCGCSSLESLPDISKWNIQNVKKMSGIFIGCSSLISLPDISKWNTINVNDMIGLFSGCSSLKLLPDISKWIINNIINMTNMLYNCSSLKSLPDISKWNTNNVTKMSYIFSNCLSLNSLPDLSKWNSNNTTKMNNIFLIVFLYYQYLIYKVKY